MCKVSNSMSERKVIPPGPKGRFPLELVRTFQTKRLTFLQSNCEQYGDVVYFKVAGREVYQLNDPELIQYVLVKHPEQFQKSPNLKRP